MSKVNEISSGSHVDVFLIYTVYKFSLFVKSHVTKLTKIQINILYKKRNVGTKLSESIKCVHSRFQRTMIVELLRNIFILSQHVATEYHSFALLMVICNT